MFLFLQAWPPAFRQYSGLTEVVSLGVWGIFRISSDGNDRMGRKIKTQNIPGPRFNPKKSNAKFPSHKYFQTALNDISTTNLFEYPQKSLLKSSYPQKILAKIILPKKILRSKIWNPKKSFDHTCHLKPGAPLLGLFRIVMCHWILVCKTAYILFIAI